jgi:hypothetical protein
VIPSLRVRSLALILPVLLGLGAEPAQAAVLWYNGDYDNRDALANGFSLVDFGGLAALRSTVYENFIVPVGQTWTVTSVFSNDQLNYNTNPVTSAAWEIRRGVSAGNGGTLVASNGTAAATQTALTRTPGFFYAASPVQITATVSPLVLTAGTYWLSVIPNEPSVFQGNFSFVMSTSGLNSVGMPPGNDDNSFISNNIAPGNPGSFNFTSTSTVEGGGTWDYSLGVNGTVAFLVPEPSSLVLVAIGGLGTSAFLRRRSRKGAR